MNFADFSRTHIYVLTGGAGSGKSTVAAMVAAVFADLFPAKTLNVLDADQLARHVVLPGSEGLAAVVQSFGDGILTSNGELNRRLLRKIIFADPVKRQTLEKIIHPRIQAELADIATRSGWLADPRPVFYEAALIFETKGESRFREVWLCHCEARFQVERLIQRDGMTRGLAEAMLSNQMSVNAKEERADQIIDTGGDLASVRAQVRRLVQDLPLDKMIENEDRNGG